MSGGTVSALTGGRFILGIGSGGIYRPEGRRPFALPRVSALDVMRDYLVTVRGLVSGKKVTYDGPAVRLRGVRLGISPPPRTPVYLGALGPKMLRLGGEVADGLLVNWCTSEQVAWSRETAAEGARAAGRDTAGVKLAEYIRVCVDSDIDAARRAFAKTAMGYALGPRGASQRARAMGYRAHFERMGFADALAELDLMRDRGASPDEMADAFPRELLLQGRLLRNAGRGRRRVPASGAGPGHRYRPGRGGTPRTGSRPSHFAGVQAGPHRAKLATLSARAQSRSEMVYLRTRRHHERGPSSDKRNPAVRMNRQQAKAGAR